MWKKKPQTKIADFSQENLSLKVRINMRKFSEKESVLYPVNFRHKCSILIVIRLLLLGICIRNEDKYKYTLDIIINFYIILWKRKSDKEPQDNP